jgi:type IV pilus assembly protein PilC
MAQFQYAGRDQTGKKRSGKVMSSSRRDAIIHLREKGIAVTDIKELELGILQKDIYIGNPVKPKHFVIYLRQFSTLLTAGISVVDSTRILANQTESKALQNALFKVEEDLRTGKSLSDAASRHSKIFPPMFVNLVKAGEVSGNLDESLDRLAIFFEKQHYAMQKVKAALAYPIAIGIFALGVVIFLLTNVVPTFADMFSDFGAELPTITKFVVAISEWMQSFWWIIILFIGMLITTFSLLMRNTTSKYYLDYAILKLPLLGKLLQKVNIARMTRTLSSLFSSSVPILQAISIVEKVVGNEVMSKVLSDSRIALQRGQALSVPFKNHWIFPPLVTQMIAIGEQTGSLDLMLNKIAEFYEKEVETATDQLKSLIEPLMIVFLAAIVGTIVASIMVPMFEIFNHIN